MGTARGNGDGSGDGYLRDGGVGPGPVVYQAFPCGSRSLPPPQTSPPNGSSQPGTTPSPTPLPRTHRFFGTGALGDGGRAGAFQGGASGGREEAGAPHLKSANRIESSSWLQLITIRNLFLRGRCALQAFHGSAEKEIIKLCCRR